MAASLWDRKLETQQTYSMGIRFLLSLYSRCLWFTKLKYPIMSNVSAVVTFPWFHAVCMSLVKVSIASLFEELDLPPNWLVGTRLYLPARNVSCLATILSNTLLRHSRRVMSLVSSWVRVVRLVWFLEGYCDSLPP